MQPDLRPRRYGRAAAIALVLAGALGAADAKLPSDVSVGSLDRRMELLVEHGIFEGESGGWRARAELLVDPATKLLTRKSFTIWDPMPSKRLQFVWLPSGDGTGADGIVSGEGQLVWRRPDKPAYDASAVVAVYRGTMKNGRPEGHGEYRDDSGLSYSGDWVDGRSEGNGTLVYPNNDQYDGPFVAGKPSGLGRYVDGAGEVYRGPFVDGLREGNGRTKLPGGLTYASQWHRGVEAPASRRIRLAQIGGGQPGSEQVDVGLAVRINPAKVSAEVTEAFASRGAESGLGYSQSNTDENLSVQPRSNRLMGMWKGDEPINLTHEEEDGKLVGRTSFDPSYGVFALGRAMQLPVSLTLDVRNRSSNTVQVTGAYLDVDSSTSDLQPAIQISIGDENECSAVDRDHKEFSPRIKIENFGWGAARNATLDFAFVAPSSTVKPQGLPLSRQIGTIDKSVYVDFERELAGSGVDMAKLARGRGLATIGGKTLGLKGMERSQGTAGKEDAVMTGAALRSRVRASGLFGAFADKIDVLGTNYVAQVSTAVAGILRYDWTDADGGSHRRESPFRSVLSLGVISSGSECGEGSSIDQVRAAALELKLDRRGYRLALPFQRKIPAARVASYAFGLTAARSSHHRFAIVLQLSDGREIRSRPVDLLYFKPRWTAKEGF